MTGCCGGGEVWIDPAELNRTASLLMEQSGRISETVAGAVSCCGVASQSGVAWVDEALTAATAEAMRVAAAYLTEAGDLHHRAGEVILEEAQPSTVSTSGSAASTAGVVMEGTGLTGTVPSTATTVMSVGGPGAGLGPGAFPASGLETLQPGDMGYLGGLEGLVASTLSGHSPTGTGGDAGSGFGGLLSAVQAQGNTAATSTAPNGTTVNPAGLFEDGAGNTGDITHVQPNLNNPGSNVVTP